MTPSIVGFCGGCRSTTAELLSLAAMLPELLTRDEEKKKRTLNAHLLMHYCCRLSEKNVQVLTRRVSKFTNIYDKYLRVWRCARRTEAQKDMTPCLRVARLMAKVTNILATHRAGRRTFQAVKRATWHCWERGKGSADEAAYSSQYMGGIICTLSALWMPPGHIFYFSLVPHKTGIGLKVCDW